MRKSPDELITELEQRGQCYIKGFGALLAGVGAGIEIYPEIIPTLSDDRAISRLQQELLDSVDRLIEVYDLIPELEAQQDYDLLGPIRERIHELRERVEIVISDPSVENCDGAHAIVIRIAGAGKQLRRRLKKLEDEIRQFPSYEGFCLVSTDCSGKLWKNGVL